MISAEQACFQSTSNNHFATAEKLIDEAIGAAIAKGRFNCNVYLPKELDDVYSAIKGAYRQAGYTVNDDLELYGQKLNENSRSVFTTYVVRLDWKDKVK